MFQLLSGSGKDGPPVLKNSGIKSFYNPYSIVAVLHISSQFSFLISGSQDVGGCPSNLCSNMVTQYAIYDSELSAHW